MNAVSFGTLITGIVLLILVLPDGVLLIQEHGNSSTAQTLNTTLINITGQYNNKLYNPFVNNISTGINASNNLASSSSTLGFALAFILPGMANIIKIMVNAPLILGGFLQVALAQFGIPGVDAHAIASMAITIGYLFMYSLAFSLWSKYPLWGATG